MPLLRRLLPLCAAALLLAACGAGNPLGLSDDDWAALTPAEKLQARTRQAELDAEARARAANARLAEARLEAERDAARLERIDRLRREGTFGDAVQCVIEDAVADFRPGWRRIAPVGATLVRGEWRHLTLRPADGSGRTLDLWSGFSPDGMTVTLCRYDPRERGMGGGNDCAGMVGTAVDLRGGLARAVDMPEILRGSLRCATLPTADMPPDIILRHP